VDNWVRLSSEYVDMLRDNPVPVDLKVVSALKKPMAIDIYWWLTKRVYNLHEPATISWQQLYQQFGSDSELKDFKRKFKRALGDVLEVYQCKITVGPAVADPGGVVEHQHAGDHAGMGEHLVQAMAHAFRGLAGQRGHVSHVRVRERDHQEMHGPFHARDHGQSLAEIDLRAARRPFQLTEPLGLAAAALAPALDPSPRRRVTALEAAFLHEPLVHAPGGVPLFARHAPVGLEPFVGLARVLARDQGTARSPPGRRNGRIIAGRVLDHGRPRNARFPGYLRMRQAFRLELPDTLLNTHRCRHSFPPEDHVLVVSTRESIRNRTAPALFFRRCHFRPPSVSNMNAYVVQIWW